LREVATSQAEPLGDRGIASIERHVGGSVGRVVGEHVV
jgi:hypothetical protein